MIIIEGIIIVDTAVLQEFLAAFSEHAKEARASAGCEFYRFAIEDATEGRVMISEGWWRNHTDLERAMTHLPLPQILSALAGRVRIDVTRDEVASPAKLDI